MNYKILTPFKQGTVNYKDLCDINSLQRLCSSKQFAEEAFLAIYGDRDVPFEDVLTAIHNYNHPHKHFWLQSMKENTGQYVNVENGLYYKEFDVNQYFFINNFNDFLFLDCSGSELKQVYIEDINNFHPIDIINHENDTAIQQYIENLMSANRDPFRVKLLKIFQFNTIADFKEYYKTLNIGN